jgi:hypothetical protein
MKRISLFFIIIICFLTSKAQNKVSIEISSDSVLSGEIIEVKYTLENIGSDFELPNLSNFTIVSGPNSSQSMSIINGVKSQKAVYTLFIMMKEEGTFFLPSFVVEGEGTTIEVPELPIKVVDSPMTDDSLNKKIARQRPITWSSNSQNNATIDLKPKTKRTIRKL